MPDRTYIAIDLKSFYASVEYADRNLDPLQTNLVVADKSKKHEQTISDYRSEITLNEVERNFILYAAKNTL